MSKRVRTLVMSFISMILSIAILAGGTYALFSTSVTIKGHLRAGNMEMKLTRLTLNGQSALKDFTNVEDNLFDLAGDDVAVIVPGGTIDATLKLEHADDSNVAFNYYVELVIKSSNDQADINLADELDMTLETGTGTNEAKRTATKNAAGNLSTENEKIDVAKGAVSEFKVTVVLSQDVSATVMGGEVLIDLIVYAEQIS